MYSLNIIKKYWAVNKWLLSFIYSLIFSLWIIEFSQASFLTLVLALVVNLLLIKGISFISDRLSRMFYRPNFYLRSEMRLVDAIDVGIISRSRDKQVYDSEEDYTKRKEFEIQMTGVWLTYLLLLSVLFTTKMLILRFMGIDVAFVVNWKAGVATFFVLISLTYFWILLEVWEYEKARFGRANIVKLIGDYVLFVVLFVAIALYLFLA